MDELIGRSVAERRFQMLLLAAFSGIALLFALVGVYGVMSYTVVQRTREIGVRMALGARPRNVWRGIVRESILLGLVATAIGVPLALLVSRLLAASLFEVGPARSLELRGYRRDHPGHGDSLGWSARAARRLRRSHDGAAS